jgi:4-hydroxy-tetrahydrodipicolinate synthase
MNSKFKGLGVAMVTPFKPDHQIDVPALRKLTNFLIEGEVDYLVVMGTTGENPTLDEKEQRQILDVVLETNNKRKPVVFGMGGNNTAAMVDRMKSYNLSGVDAILTASPFYNKPNQNGIFAHYTVIADAAPLPVILYNVPSRTGSNMTAETTLKLAEHRNIIATKEASGNFTQCMDILKNRPEDFLVISGEDALTLPLMSCGMEGVISVIGNAFPAPFSKMVHAALDEKWAEAKILHYHLLDMMNTIFDDGSPGGIKVLMNQLGLCLEEVRMPLAKPSESVKRKLVTQLTSFKQTLGHN